MKLSLAQLKPLVSRALGIPSAALEQAFGPATAEEIPAILALRRPILTGAAYHDLWWDDDAYVRWRFFHPHSLTAGASSFLALRHQGQLLGGIGIDRVQVFVDGERHPAVRMFDIMVQSEYDGRGLGALINLLVFEEHAIGMVVGDNPASRSMLERLFVPLPELACHKQLIHSRVFVERYLPSRQLANAASLAIDVALKAYLRVRRPSLGGLEIEPVTAFDDQIDRLSEQLGQRGQTFVHRTGDYLNWRFVANPRAHYGCYLARQGSQVRAYVVTRLERARAGESRAGTIVDWLADDDRLLAPLFARATDALRQAGAEVVTVWTYAGAAQAALRQLAFVTRPEERRPYFLYAERSPLKDRLLDPARWFVTAGDFDMD